MNEKAESRRYTRQEIEDANTVQESVQRGWSQRKFLDIMRQNGLGWTRDRYVAAVALAETLVLDKDEDSAEEGETVESHETAVTVEQAEPIQAAEPTIEVDVGDLSRQEIVELLTGVLDTDELEFDMSLEVLFSVRTSDVYTADGARMAIHVLMQEELDRDPYLSDFGLNREEYRRIVEFSGFRVGANHSSVQSQTRHLTLEDIRDVAEIAGNNPDAAERDLLRAFHKVFGNYESNRVQAAS